MLKLEMSCRSSKAGRTVSVVRVMVYRLVDEMLSAMARSYSEAPMIPSAVLKYAYRFKSGEISDIPDKERSAAERCLR